MLSVMGDRILADQPTPGSHDTHVGAHQQPIAQPDGARVYHVIHGGCGVDLDQGWYHHRPVPYVVGMFGQSGSSDPPLGPQSCRERRLVVGPRIVMCDRIPNKRKLIAGKIPVARDLGKLIRLLGGNRISGRLLA